MLLIPSYLFSGDEVIMSKKIIFTDDAPKAIGPYSQGVVVGNTLYISGQIPLNPNTDILIEGTIKEQAEQEGLDKIFVKSGFEWREPGCSMCLAMNADKLKPEERCASTSNRNFEGRQGRGGRTHLVSPGMAAAAAISGNLDDVRKYQN